MLIETLLHTIQHYKLLSADETIIIAVSGGIDSIVLLHALVQLQAKLGYRLHVATVDHQLRTESAEDAKFVEALAHQYSLSCTVGQVDVRTIAEQQQIGIEAAARDARYQLLRQVAYQYGAKTIVTAHHQNDQSETILQHLIRGTGLQGLGGMHLKSPLPNDPNLTIVRPFLTISRQTIEDYCAENNLKFREDASNASTDYTRNAIRLQLLPALRAYNPAIDDALVRLANSVQIDEDFIEAMFQRIVIPEVILSDRITVGKSIFLGWHPALQRRFILWAVAKMGGEPSYERVVSAVDHVVDGRVGSKIEFAGSICLRIDYEAIQIEPSDYQPSFEGYWQINQRHDLLLGDNIFGEWHLRMSEQLLINYSTRIACDLSAKIYIRPRKSGDIFYADNLKGHSVSIKDWMINHKIPRGIRDSIPLLLVNDQIKAIIVGNQWFLAYEDHFIIPTQRYLYFYLYKLSI